MSELTSFCLAAVISYAILTFVTRKVRRTTTSHPVPRWRTETAFFLIKAVAWLLPGAALIEIKRFQKLPCETCGGLPCREGCASKPCDCDICDARRKRGDG